jgi:hypothetical protein
LHGAQIIFTVIIPVALPVVTLVDQRSAVIGAIFGVVSFVVDIAIVEPIIKKRKTKAAKI